MNETPQKKSGWRILRRLLLALAILATLIAIFYAEEDWRGKRAWDNYQREAAARGERLDPASVIPPAVPDDQNFYFAPIVAHTLDWNRDQNTKSAEPHVTNAANRINFDIYRGGSKIWPNHVGNWQKGKLTDLKEWQQYFQAFAQSPEAKTNGFPVAAQPQTPAADILLALSVFDPATEELRQASRRPYARLPLDYESGFDTAGELLPCLAKVKRYGQYLSLRILAELDNGQSEPALDDVKLLLRVTDSLRNQPYLISHLVRMAMMSITLQPIYEGLAQQRWTDAQLLGLEQALAKQDFLADFQRAMQGEKVFAIQSFEKQRITHKYKTMEGDSGTNIIMTVSLRWMPSAFFYQNELAFAQMHRQYILPLIDQTNRIIAPATLRQVLAAVQVQKKHYSPYKAQAQMVFPAIAPSVKTFATIQAQVDLARVACALERFRLAHSEYPETLDTLAPQFIEKMPHDIINGQPLHYRRTDDGQFVLYSVGWDEKDDGGKIFLTKGGSVDREKGDWVWKYPTQ
jgi:hypothetical protein